MAVCHNGMRRHRQEVWRGRPASRGEQPPEPRSVISEQSAGGKQITAFSLSTTVYPLPSTLYPLPSTVYRLPSTVYRLPSTVCRLPSKLTRVYTLSASGKVAIGSEGAPEPCWIHQTPSPGSSSSANTSNVTQPASPESSNEAVIIIAVAGAVVLLISAALTLWLSLE